MQYVTDNIAWHHPSWVRIDGHTPHSAQNLEAEAEEVSLDTKSRALEKLSSIRISYPDHRRRKQRVRTRNVRRYVSSKSNVSPAERQNEELEWHIVVVLPPGGDWKTIGTPRREISKANSSFSESPITYLNGELIWTTLETLRANCIYNSTYFGSYPSISIAQFIRLDRISLSSMPKDSVSTNPSAKTDRQGLELAEHRFGPLLHPASATQSAWTSYSINRRQTMKTYRAVLPVPCKDSEDDSEEDESEEYDSEYEDWLGDSIKACVSQIEKEMDLEVGTLQKCITIVRDCTDLYDSQPRTTDNIVRIYSPTMPMYIDVHFRYHCRSRWSEVEWFYGLGYKIQHRPRATVCDALAFERELIEGIPPPDLHTRNGWQSICWGYFNESNGNHGKKWRRAELAKMELYEEGVMDVYETLFGDLEKPAATDPDAMLAYRRSLVRGIRLLLAAVGVSYDVACTDDECDKRPRQLMLEGLSDNWVGRGIRNACGLRLSRDAEEEREGAKQRRKEAKGSNNSYDDSEDEEHYRSGDDDSIDE